jgi:short subunit dehydrogenase-like uncharacterized protein
VYVVKGKLLIYGATGYTGKLLAVEARKLGLDPILAARNEVPLRVIAGALELSYRAFSLEDPAALRGGLDDVSVLLNAAGPFVTTSAPLLQACLEQGVHYLDVSGEVTAIEHCARWHVAAKRRGVMIMPGVGFDVVPSDCLAVHVAQRLAAPRNLAIAISGQRLISRGSARTMIDQLADPLLIRRDGCLRRVRPASIERRFDFGAGARWGIAVSWGDVSSAYFSTGVADITTYFEASMAVRVHNSLLAMYGWSVPFTPWQRVLRAGTEFLPAGPSASESASQRATIVAEVEDAAGRIVGSRLYTPEAYAFTALSGAAIAARVLAGDWQAGFETPARVFGADFVLDFPDVSREDFA